MRFLLSILLTLGLASEAFALAPTRTPTQQGTATPTFASTATITRTSTATPTRASTDTPVPTPTITLVPLPSPWPTIPIGQKIPRETVEFFLLDNGVVVSEFDAVGLNFGPGADCSIQSYTIEGRTKRILSCNFPGGGPTHTPTPTGPTPTRTATPTKTFTPSLTPTPTATSTPGGGYGEDGYGEGGYGD